MPLNPDLADVIEAAFDAHMRELHTCTIGQVYSYDAQTQRAAIWPLIRSVEYSVEDGRTSYDPPVLHSVPVVWPRAGGYALHFPLKKGDHVLLVFAESDVSGWRFNPKGEPPPTDPNGDNTIGFRDPADLTRHSMSAAFAIAGVMPNQYPIEDAPTDHAVLIVPEAGMLRVSTAGAGHTEKVALAEKVAAQLTALKDAISNAAPVANDGGAALKTAILAALADWPGDVASTTLEAEGEP